jgi:hypothetical protein
VIATWVGERRVTVRSLVLAYIGIAAPFDIAQLAILGQWRLDLALGNALGAGVLFGASGLIWNLDLRRPHHLVPAGAVAGIAMLCLFSWSWS